jgi:hypothetical protein
MEPGAMPINLTGRMVLMMLAFAGVAIVWGSWTAGAAWRALSSRYRIPGLRFTPDQRFRFVSLRTMDGLIGGANYRSCAEVELNERGLLLSMWAPFRLFHPPMLIPWDAVKQWERKLTPWGDAVRLELDEELGLMLYGKVATAVLATLQTDTEYQAS